MSTQHHHNRKCLTLSLTMFFLERDGSQMRGGPWRAFGPPQACCFLPPIASIAASKIWLIIGYLKEAWVKLNYHWLIHTRGRTDRPIWRKLRPPHSYPPCMCCHLLPKMDTYCRRKYHNFDRSLLLYANFKLDQIWTQDRPFHQLSPATKHLVAYWSNRRENDEKATLGSGCCCHGGCCWNKANLTLVQAAFTPSNDYQLLSYYHIL